jgi:hypothetical protein
MASAWIKTRTTKGGAKRYRVEFRLGGRESQVRYAGSFRTRRDALARKAWVTSELVARRVPDLSTLDDPPRTPTLREAAERWRASRIDVDEGTRTNDRVNTERI